MSAELASCPFDVACLDVEPARPCRGCLLYGPGPAPVVRPRPGLRFLHAHQITAAATRANPIPEPCTVTAVRSGVVYYRNSTGFLTKTPRIVPTPTKETGR